MQHTSRAMHWRYSSCRCLVAETGVSGTAASCHAWRARGPASCRRRAGRSVCAPGRGRRGRRRSWQPRGRGWPRTARAPARRSRQVGYVAAARRTMLSPVSRTLRTNLPCQHVQPHLCRRRHCCTAVRLTQLRARRAGGGARPAAGGGRAGGGGRMGAAAAALCGGGQRRGAGRTRQRRSLLRGPLAV